MNEDATIHQNLAEEKARFLRVLAARTTARGLLELFGKLQESEKFSEEAKPMCFALLLKESLQRLADKDLKSLLLTLGRMQLLPKLTDSLPAEELKPIVALLATRCISAAPSTSEGYMAALQGLEYAGAHYDRAEALDLCFRAGFSEEFVGQLADLTYEAHYIHGPRDYFQLSAR